MRADRFDEITRFLAMGMPAGSRRALLRAFGLGGVAAVLPATGAAAGPGAPPAGRAARAQAAPLDEEIDQLAFSLEYDVDRIFRFVRDEVIYDPYAGVLRGARGTLWGLAGNAADQAVLLAALLEASAVPTRFVTGALASDAGPALLASGDLDGEALRSRAARLFAPTQEEAASPDLSAEDEAFAERFTDFADEVLGLIGQHTADGVATVREALDGAGIGLPAAVATVPEEEIGRHLWVQYRSGQRWVDLDPSIPDAEPGDVFADEPTVLEELPADLVHRVSFRLVAERVSGTSTERRELLTFEAPSSELLGVPIALIHPQPEALSQIGVSIGGAIEGFRNFVPSLLVGEETVFGSPVTFGTGGGILDALGGGGVEGDTLAEWIEVTVTSPAGARTATRTVFDRVAAEDRAAGTIDPMAVPPVDLVDAGDPESSFLPLAGLWSFGVVAGDIPERRATRAVPEELIVDDLLPALHAYHYARGVQALRLPELDGVRLFHDEPNVTAFTLRPTEVETDAETATFGLDLLHRSVAVAPGDGGEVHALVAAGVMAHAVEQAMFEAGGMEPINLPVTAPVGVVRVFAEARAQGIGVVVLEPGGRTSAMPELPEGARGLVEAALLAGQVVIMPERPVEIGGRERTGWWLVDPATGATRDQMDDGGGSTMTEYALLAVKIARCIAAFAGLGAAMGAVTRMSVGLLTGAAFDARTSTGGLLGGGAAAGLGYGCVG